MHFTRRQILLKYRRSVLKIIRSLQSYRQAFPLFPYDWSYTEDDGTTESQKAEEGSILEKYQAGVLPEIICDAEDKSLKFMFSRKPEKVTVKKVEHGNALW